MLASGDRRKALSHIHVPTLVIHGDADPLFRPKGGEATAAAILGLALSSTPAWAMVHYHDSSGQKLLVKYVS
jgi:pimeloyl-ACP methyl ester carboxylesterase